MQIRPFRAEDLPTLKTITADAFDGVSIDQAIEREFGLINGHGWKWRKARHIDADVQRDPEGVFVVEVDGEIAGCLTMWQDHEAGIGHIPNVAFRPEYRGKGYGRKAIEFALDRFRQAGLKYARIETLVQNDVGNHLYQSLGFREVARQIHFVADLNAADEDRC